eukprot:scaffold21348_cov35-Phaeocystis_antarctica.AAC.3
MRMAWACAWPGHHLGDQCGPGEPCSPGANQTQSDGGGAAAWRRGAAAWRRDGAAAGRRGSVAAARVSSGELE